MGTPYTIRPGDSLSAIARDQGYASWEEIYNHADNASFRELRPNPNVIAPGDVLILPDRTNVGPSESAPDIAEPTSPGGEGESEEGPPPLAGSAARQTADSVGLTALNLGYETRVIIAAQGIEYNNADYDAGLATATTEKHKYYWKTCRIPQGLQEDFPTMVVNNADDSAEYVDDRQRVRFIIRVVNTKDAYKSALETPEWHVLYGGHARYGRGPCFGTSHAPGENWEQGSNPSTTGIFRMGYPIIGVHFSEIRSHGYSFYPVAADGPKPAAQDCHPDINRAALRKITLPDDLQGKVLAQGLPLVDHYWGYSDNEGALILLNSGWTGTISDPMDLGAIDMRCRCFCHLGCSTKRHNWKIVRERKAWKRTETERFAYFTTAPSSSLLWTIWIKAVFSYPKPNAYQSWYPSLEWAKVRSNQLIVSMGKKAGIWTNYQVY